MDHLLRPLAPISDSGWHAIEDRAKQLLGIHLAARKLVDFDGPHGWPYAAVPSGRTEPAADGDHDVHVALRGVLPLAEVRVPFRVARSELAAIDRGAKDVELDDLDRAAKRIALRENVAVFHGDPSTGIKGITERSTHDALTLGPDAERYPASIAKAVDVLRRAGIGGPYGLAVSLDGYTRIIETAEHGGYPLLDHLHKILGGSVVWAPGIEGALVLSLREEDDFVFVSGQDIAIGYEGHDTDSVQLYFEESFTFCINEPSAAIALRTQA